MAGLLAALSTTAIVVAGWIGLHARLAARRRIARFVMADSLAEPLVVTARRGRRRLRQSGALVGGNFVTRRLELELRRARVELTPTEVLVACAFFAGAGLLAPLVATGQVAVAAAGMLLGGAAPLIWLRRRYGRLLRVFQDQLPATVESIVASVRAGNDLATALGRVAAEAPEPTRSALARAVRGIDFGMSVEEALRELAERYRSDDLELMVSAIAIEQTVGGNLPRVLEMLAATTRQRVVLRREVNSLTAQQRYSAWLLSLFPVAAFIGMALISPDYIAPMLEGNGRIALLVAGLLIAVSFVVMKRLGDVEL